MFVTYCCETIRVEEIAKLKRHKMKNRDSRSLILTDSVTYLGVEAVPKPMAPHMRYDMTNIATTDVGKCEILPKSIESGKIGPGRRTTDSLRRKGIIVGYVRGP